MSVSVSVSVLQPLEFTAAEVFTVPMMGLFIVLISSANVSFHDGLL